MPVDPSVIQALSAAVEADPGNHALRVHLAGLLLEAGREAEALEHYAHVLASDPAHIDALRGAKSAAAALGDPRSQAYARLLDGLQGSTSVSDDDVPAVVPPAAEPTPLDDSGDEDDDENEDHEFYDRPRLRVVDGGLADAAVTEIPKITLADVGGMETVKRRLNIAFLAPLRNPEMRRMYGKSLRGGLLLYGPPGCGKTFIARATAGELGARFLSVTLTDVLDMWLGESERKLHEIFEAARRNAPAVLFFDEIDALGHKRSHLRGGGGHNVVNALLHEMDGADGGNDDIFVLGATNHPWDVDPALRRPGRFDRMVLVLPPDTEARDAILEHHLKERPQHRIDRQWLATKTNEFSGADLAHLCESAVELAMEESLETGKVRPLEMKDFKKALKEVRTSVRPWFDTAKNYAMFANEGGMYDELLEYIKARRY